MEEFILRLQPTPGHRAVGDAYTGCVPEGDADVELIIISQIGTVNDVDDLLTVFFPVILSHGVGDPFQLRCHHEIIRAKAFRQRIMHSVHMLILQFP